MEYLFMLLNDVLESVSVTGRSGVANPDIKSITYDSRRVKPGGLFICIRGGHFDGHNFINSALSAGAAAVLVDREDIFAALPKDVIAVLVPDTRAVLPGIAGRFYGNPSCNLKLVGITGTKGKTTTTYLIESIIRAAGMGAGIIGTMGARINGAAIPGDRTTPESADLQELFSLMLKEGVSAAAMEVSSHALELGRTEGTEFDVGVFTNLTRDHLDFHKSLENYFEAKKRLFVEYPAASNKAFAAVVNTDDPAGVDIAAAVHGPVITIGVKNPADITAENIHASASGVSFDVKLKDGEFHVDLKLGGIFNVYNSLSAIGAACALGIGADHIKAGLEAVASVAGRFESVQSGQKFSVLVDYAHTPDSLENILSAARDLTSERLIVVFGCGGDRDRGKRPMMGGIGAHMADVCIITSDNPRSEPPQSIIKEIMAGTVGGPADIEAIVDHRAAIARAISLARPGDIVVVAGKGHETYQIFRDRTIHFDDREVVREVLSAMKR
jgi:UDP-N-acetylmuramoyl-L-alanyl-D-glutamate--2,6-diaminopimelate ligase